MCCVYDVCAHLYFRSYSRVIRWKEYTICTSFLRHVVRDMRRIARQQCRNEQIFEFACVARQCCIRYTPP